MKKPENHRHLIPIAAALAFLIAVMLPHFAEAAPKKAPAPRDAEVQNVKENYWNRTSDGDVEVVQNRLYSKKNRLSLQGGAGVASADPFLNVQYATASLGYHFTETFAVNVIGRKYFVGSSSYQDELSRGLVTGAAAVANVNEPQSYVGGELEYSPLYGKISLSGSQIVHYDFHLLAGLGMTETDTGSNFTPSLGLGPQFYLSNSVAVRLDYRITRYKEEIPDLVFRRGGTVGERTNYSHLFNVGLVLFL